MSQLCLSRCVPPSINSSVKAFSLCFLSWFRGGLCTFSSWWEFTWESVSGGALSIDDPPTENLAKKDH